MHAGGKDVVDFWMQRELLVRLGLATDQAAARQLLEDFEESESALQLRRERGHDCTLLAVLVAATDAALSGAAPREPPAPAAPAEDRSNATVRSFQERVRAHGGSLTAALESAAPIGDPGMRDMLFRLARLREPSDFRQCALDAFVPLFAGCALPSEPAVLATPLVTPGGGDGAADSEPTVLATARLAPTTDEAPSALKPPPPTRPLPASI
jgi:hypothetical protein